VEANLGSKDIEIGCIILDQQEESSSWEKRGIEKSDESGKEYKWNLQLEKKESKKRKPEESDHQLLRN